ncbi:unnamed protein product [Prorocentrum cordatum]|uniref:Cellulase n=1 Tax=Prorocentrum cordatum TaxID=2364126 RepID=A0ABN9UXG1_9DINO|nr:unnamed protein product [Polarella glacialis]
MPIPRRGGASDDGAVHVDVHDDVHDVVRLQRGPVAGLEEQLVLRERADQLRGATSATQGHGRRRRGIRDWCCKNMEKGCEQDGYFDCRQGPWPPKKRHWCCENEGRMCPDARRYACEAGPWPPAKRTWCCEKEGKGCVETV